MLQICLFQHAKQNSDCQRNKTVTVNVTKTVTVNVTKTVTVNVTKTVTVNVTKQ